MENPVPSLPWSESRCGVEGFVSDEGDVTLNERVRRVVKLPESEDPARSDLERMLSIIFAYRECRFLRGLGCERERKNNLRDIGDVAFTDTCTISPFGLGVRSPVAEIARKHGLAGHLLEEKRCKRGKSS